MFCAGGVGACSPASTGVLGTTVVSLPSDTAKSRAMVASTLTGVRESQTDWGIGWSGSARSSATENTEPGVAEGTARGTAVSDGSMADADTSGDETTGISSGTGVELTRSTRKVTSGSHHGVSMRTSSASRL